MRSVQANLHNSRTLGIDVEEAADLIMISEEEIVLAERSQNIDFYIYVCFIIVRYLFAIRYNVFAICRCFSLFSHAYSCYFVFVLKMYMLCKKHTHTHFLH